jgi:hypothetical protein
MSMARLWREQGKRDEAREFLGPVYGWFTEGFDARDSEGGESATRRTGRLRQRRQPRKNRIGRGSARPICRSENRYCMHGPLPKPLAELIRFVSVPIIGLALVADAWAHCEYLSGSSRTDCFMGRARILGRQSDIAAGAARLRVDQEFLRAATGVQPKPQTAKSKHRVRLK